MAVGLNVGVTVGGSGVEVGEEVGVGRGVEVLNRTGLRWVIWGLASAWLKGLPQASNGQINRMKKRKLSRTEYLKHVKIGG